MNDATPTGNGNGNGNSFLDVPARHKGMGDLAATKTTAPTSALAGTDQARAMAEVQAALVIAQGRPRDEVRAADRLTRACQRPRLAQVAAYEYPRGGQKVTGPSIRLAETAARCWGNCNYGFREISRGKDFSEVEAFAWDLETNTKATRQFNVPHAMETRNGLKKLTSERDIYEFIANHAQRRVRACILEIIPGDVIEEAMEQCETTLKAAVTEGGADLKQVAKDMADAFKKDFKVTRAQLEKRLGHRMDSISPAEIMSLRKVYQSIRDGFSDPKDWFEEADTADKANARRDKADAAAQPQT